MRTSLAALLTGGAASLFAVTLVAQGPPAPPTITPGDNLVVENVPAIPASLAAETGRYTESRSAAFMDWHPLQREVLISTRFANAAQIHRVGMPGGARRQLTFEAEPVTWATYQPKTGAYVVFRRDTGGNEFFQLYRYDLTDGAITRLTDGGRSQNDDVVWSRSGERIAYASTRRNGADRDIYVMDPATPAGDRRVLQVSGGGWFPLDWSPDDRSILLLEYVSINKSRLWQLEVASGRNTALTPDEDVSYGSAVYAADGRGVYVATDRNHEFLRLAYLDLATRTVTPIDTGINWNIEGMDLAPDGRTLAFAANEAGLSRLYLMDTGSRRVRPVTTLPAGVISALKWHPSRRELAVSITAGGAPVDVYSVDTQNQQVTRWTESELGGLPASALTEPTLIRWNSFDGREITGFYFHPPARFSGKRPVIVDIHGGPESQYRPGFLGRSNYFLQELGVAVIEPNVRGSDGYGKTFLQLDNGVKREDSVKDIGALLDWIATQPQLDASRVLVMGGSYGGYMTLAVATHYSDRIRAAIDIVGISHMGTFLKNTESYRRDLRRAEYGDERDPAIAAFFDQTAPLNNAGRIRKPLLVIQGGNDPRVPRTESEQMVARVKENGTPVWYLMARDEGHGFRKKNNVDFQFYTMVMFMRQHLLDS